MAASSTLLWKFGGSLIFRGVMVISLGFVIRLHVIRRSAEWLETRQRLDRTHHVLSRRTGQHFVRLGTPSQQTCQGCGGRWTEAAHPFQLAGTYPHACSSARNRRDP